MLILTDPYLDVKILEKQGPPKSALNKQITWAKLLQAGSLLLLLLLLQ